MNIITEKEKLGRIEDGINTLLNLSDEQFEEVLKRLKPKSAVYMNRFDDINFFYTTDKCGRPSNHIVVGLENESDSRQYIDVKKIFIDELLSKIDEKRKEFPKDSIQYERCNRLIESRSIDVYKNFFMEDYPNDKKVIEKIFEIIQDEDEFQKFLNYNEFKDYFNFDSKKNLGDYLKYFGKIFGNITVEKYRFFFIKKENIIYSGFFIPQIEEIKEKVLKIYDKYNVKRYSDKRYEFRYISQTDKVIRKGDEPEWTINPELREAVFKDMPKEMSLEEKAVYIYMKLCKELVYDEGYWYREKEGSVPYTSDFSKDKLESIKPGSKIICFEFSRICAKMINELEGDIEAVIVSQGANKGHFYTGFYTDNASVNLELTNKDPLSDFTRAKMGLKYKGIYSNFDRKNILPGIIDKVGLLVAGKEKVLIDDYLKVLSELPIQNTKNDTKNKNEFILKLEAFIETMKEKNINGNEFTQLLMNMRKELFKDDRIKIVNVGKKEGNKYRRFILIGDKEAENKGVIYRVNTDTLLCEECDIEEIINDIKSGEFVYENNNNRIDWEII